MTFDKSLLSGGDGHCVTVFMKTWSLNTTEKSDLFRYEKHIPKISSFRMHRMICLSHSAHLLEYRNKLLTLSSFERDSNPIISLIPVVSSPILNKQPSFVSAFFRLINKEAEGFSDIPQSKYYTNTNALDHCGWVQCKYKL